MQLRSPLYQQTGLSRACAISLASVPTCAGQCRFVRVIRVLDPSRTRTLCCFCVGVEDPCDLEVSARYPGLGTVGWSTPRQYEHGPCQRLCC